MKLAQAMICHVSKERLRLRIGERKGDRTFLTWVKDELKGFAPSTRIEASVMTGSVLIIGSEVDVAKLAKFAEQNKLFKLVNSTSSATPILRQIETPIKEADRMIQQFAGGRFDLTGAAILALVSMGIFQLVRGYRSMPPWYTVFWYAFSILTLANGQKSGGS